MNALPQDAVTAAAAAIHSASCEWDLSDCVEVHVHDRAAREALEAATPYIRAAERERIRQLATEHQATYRPFDADLVRLIPGFDGQPGPDPLGDPFADLIGGDPS